MFFIVRPSVAIALFFALSIVIYAQTQPPITFEKNARDVLAIEKDKVPRIAGKENSTENNTGDQNAVMTTQQGIPVGNEQNSLKLGVRGPTLLDDFQLREKIFHFDHERIPERVVHARGSGAHGYYENYESLADLTKADIFQRAGEKTPAFVRFSTVAGSAGSPDLARDVRGFAVKLYTQQGNWDIVGNNIPVFFIQDAIKFPDLIHAAKPEHHQEWPKKLCWLYGRHTDHGWC
jgi:catalase